MESTDPPKNYKNTAAFKHILRFYWERLNLTLGTTSSTLKSNNISMSPKKLSDMVAKGKDGLSSDIGFKNYGELIDLMAKEYKIKGEKDLLAIVATNIYSMYLNRLNKSKAAQAALESKESHGLPTIDYRHFLPLMDVETSDKAMYDTRTGEAAHHLTYLAFSDFVKSLGSKEKEDYNTRLTPVKLKYDPTMSGGKDVLDLMGDMVSSVNTHVLPPWRKEEVLSPKLPQEFKDLMDHLFPNKQCRKYILFWAYHMLDSRSNVHLLLHGARGIGKNLLITIFSNLVGKSNYYIVPKRFFDTTFDSELKNRRLIYFDEHVINDRKNLAQFKTYHEPFMAYHTKGLAIRNTDKIHASHVIANNLEEKNHLVYGSRRFSVPILTDEPILDVWGEKKLDKLIALSEDQDFLSNVGWWILNNGNCSEFRREKEYRTSLFYKIVNDALWPWQKAIIGLIETCGGDDILIDSYKDKLTLKSGSVVGRERIGTFLSSHKDSEGNVFGKVITVDKKYVIKPLGKYAEMEGVEVKEVKTETDYTKGDF